MATNNFVGTHGRVVYPCGGCSVKMEVEKDGQGHVIETVETDGHKNHLSLDLGERFPVSQIHGAKVAVTDGASDWQIQL